MLQKLDDVQDKSLNHVEQNPTMLHIEPGDLSEILVDAGRDDVKGSARHGLAKLQAVALEQRQELIVAAAEVNYCVSWVNEHLQLLRNNAQLVDLCEMPAVRRVPAVKQRLNRARHKFVTVGSRK